VTHGTWIRTSRLYIFAAISVIALAGASLTLVSAWFALLLVPAALFGYIAVVLALTVWRLGPRGGNFQRRIHDLIVARAAVDPAGRGLDIGCGSGAPPAPTTSLTRHLRHAENNHATATQQEVSSAGRPGSDHSGQVPQLSPASPRGVPWASSRPRPSSGTRA